MRTMRKLCSTTVCGPLAAAALVVGLVLVAPGHAAAAGPTMLTSCSFAALSMAVSGGGTIDYEQDCTGSSQVVFPTEIIFKGTVDIEANGFGVSFDSGYSTRFFDLVGGHLTLSGITLLGGAAIGQNGQNGQAGQAGQAGQRRSRIRIDRW
jgi:hypothetical protein